MCHRHSRVKTMTVDDRLQHLSDCKSSVGVLFIETRIPLSPMGVAQVVDIEKSSRAVKASGSKHLIPP